MGVALSNRLIVAQEDFDVCQGVSWTERSQHGVLGVALDYADTLGKKNAFIDAVHQRALEQTLRRLDRRYHRALDFGCGGGRLLPLIYRFADDTYGVDRTPACIEMARAAAVIADDRLVCWRDGALPFTDGFFELFLCAYVLLTTAALDALLPELSRVLAPDGVGVLLEQVDAGRGLTVERYRETITRNGFSLERAFSIRRSIASGWQRLAANRFSPTWLTRLLARVQVATMRDRQPEAAGYYDYVFVLRRERDSRN